MMKSIMRLDKTQVPSLIKFTTASATPKQWSKNIPVMAGYKNYDCMIVGGGGGASGTSSYQYYYAHGSGGGGGGAVKFSGLLSDLAAITDYQVGLAGTHGANTGNRVDGKNGGTGGTSLFADKQAFGGKGGDGAAVDVQSGEIYSMGASIGGDGGTNNTPYGTGGFGMSGPDPGYNGTWETSGSLSGSRGGGGGGGKGNKTGSGAVTYWNASRGGYGAYGGGDASSIYGDGTSKGGNGGGADIEPILGESDRYGSYAAGSKSTGVVIIKLS